MLVCEKHILNLNQGPFIGREEAKKIFFDKLNSLQEKISTDSNDYGQTDVLVYYGIGGIGKTRLLSDLQSSIRQENVYKSVYFDFDEVQDKRSVLERLKNIFSEKYDFQFPLFELAEYNYARKVGETVESPTLKGYIGKSKFLKKVVIALGAIPVVGIVPKVLDAADTGLAYIKDYFNKHSDDIKVIENMTSTQLMDYLVYLFACDMRENLEREDKVTVIFLDTYERLVNEMSLTGEQLNNDLWLRGAEGLIRNLPNVLWVIGGRETLKWERVNPEWHEEVEQIKLDNLVYDEVEELLVECGIEERELRRAIFELTNGTPVYVRMCVDQYLSLKSRGKKPEISDFDKDINVLSERFARYMDTGKKEAVYLLSCLRVWDDEMLKDIGHLIIPSFSIVGYSTIKDFSFVEQCGEKSYRMHPSVQNVFFTNCPEQIKKDVLKIVPKYVSDKMSEMGISDIRVFLSMQWLLQFGVRNYSDEGEFCNFYARYMRVMFRELSKSGQHNLTESLLLVLKNLSEKSKTLNKALYLTERSRMMNDRKEYAEAGEYAKAAVAIYREAGVENDINKVAALQNLAISQMKCNEISKARETLDEAIGIRKNIDGSFYPDELALIQDSISALCMGGDYKRAIEMERRVVKKMCCLSGEHHIDTLRAKNNLAYMFFRSKKYGLASFIYDAVYERFKEMFGDEHSEVISTKNNIILCKKICNRIREEVFKNVDTYIEGLSKLKERRLYFGKELKAENFKKIKYCKLDLSDIVLVYDDALFSSFSSGIVLTDEAIYTSRNEMWKFADMSHISYDDASIIAYLRDGRKVNVFDMSILNSEEKVFLAWYLQKISEIL